MKLKITVDVFSGRENPVIELDHRASLRALDRLQPDKKLSARERKVPEGILGYRGLVIEQIGRGTTRLPREVRLVNGKLLGLGLAHRAADQGFEAYIGGRRFPVGSTRAASAFTKYVARELNRYRRIEAAYDFARVKWPVLKRCPCAPIYEPAWWNDAGTRQYNNNCYNYATNYRSDTFAQPGRAAGAMYTALTCPAVRAGAKKDELIPTRLRFIRCPPKGHLVALVVAPNWDFHWYRLGTNMKWTHKPGSTAVTNLDNSGHIINDPRTADRGPYSQFCGFMIVMHGHIKIS